MSQWGLTPDIFNLGYIFPIPKKGTFTPENSRPISLLEVHLKLLTRIVNRRLVHSLLDEGYFSDTQFGFLAGRSCPDAFHILLGAIEDAAERQREIHLCLVDLTKAFDSLSPQSLAQAYREAGLSEKSVTFLGSMDGKGMAQVLTPFGPTKKLPIKWGVRQGEVLSPLKFIAWLNPWLEYVLANLESKGFSLVEDLFNWEAGGWVLRPWIEVKRSHHEQPCAWYTALQSVAQHIVAEEFRDSRLEPHEYGRLGPEDEEPFSDSDTSDSEDSPQPAAGSPPLVWREKCGP